MLCAAAQPAAAARPAHLVIWSCRRQSRSIAPQLRATSASSYLQGGGQAGGTNRVTTAPTLPATQTHPVRRVRRHWLNRPLSGRQLALCCAAPPASSPVEQGLQERRVLQDVVPPRVAPALPLYAHQRPEDLHRVLASLKVQLLCTGGGRQGAGGRGGAAAVTKVLRPTRGGGGSGVCVLCTRLCAAGRASRRRRRSLR